LLTAITANFFEYGTTSTDYSISEKMYRRSLGALASQGRTIVRDPRKTKASGNVAQSTDSNAIVNNLPERSNSIAKQKQHQSFPSPQVQKQPLPFAPTEQNQNSIGSMVGSYMLAGFGMGLGMVLVRIILGG
jgi:hypothetical protein